jgi:antitoxin VapB
MSMEYAKECATLPQPEPAPSRVRLFRNTRKHAIRIPGDIELPGQEAPIRREGDHLIIEPVRECTLLDLLADWGPLDEPFPDVDETLPPLRHMAL